MANELIINVTLGETRVARLENGVVAELHIEHASWQGVVGNIYKGKVVRVMPGMQAAFIEVGLDRTAFLHVSDVAQEITRWEEEGIEAKRARRRGSAPKIEQVLKEGVEILVQVEKEPIGTKGARLTSHVSLPGRYLVYLPTVNHLGISRRIEDEKERRRLRQIVDRLRPRGSGFIIRTAAEAVVKEEVEADMGYLIRHWQDIEKKAVKVPGLVHQELDVVLRVVRDHFTGDIDRLIIDDKKSYERIKAFVNQFMPGLTKPIELYENPEPLFDYYGIEIEITRALGQKVWMKSGGYIIIEQTEALTAIDVNTGRFVGRSNLEDTILKTNLEAVKEIVYQLRLRDIGGIIILDFIDMERQANRLKVYNALKEALKMDRTRTTISQISELGLVEMTRKRARENLRSQLTDPCHYCDGKGYLKSSRTICYEVFREILREAPLSKAKQWIVYAHPHVANLFYDEERKNLEELESLTKRRISIKAMPDYHLEQFEVAEG